MPEANLMGTGQRHRAVDGDAKEFLDGERLGQTAAQCLAFHVLHHNEEFILYLDHIVDGGDMRIIQARGAFCFFPKVPAGVLVSVQSG